MFNMNYSLNTIPQSVFVDTLHTRKGLPLKRPMSHYLLFVCFVVQRELLIEYDPSIRVCKHVTYQERFTTETTHVSLPTLSVFCCLI